jgi:hypothetical protein
MCDLAFSSPSASILFGSIKDLKSNPSKYAIYLGQTPLGGVAIFVSSRSPKEMPRNNIIDCPAVGFLLLVPCNIRGSRRRKRRGFTQRRLMFQIFNNIFHKISTICLFFIREIRGQAVVACFILICEVWQFSTGLYYPFF